MKNMEDKWIKVSEKKPNHGQMVNAYNYKTKIEYPKLYWDEDEEKWFDENYSENGEYDLPPTHWCKLGKTPKFKSIK